MFFNIVVVVQGMPRIFPPKQYQHYVAWLRKWVPHWVSNSILQSNMVPVNTQQQNVLGDKNLKFNGYNVSLILKNYLTSIWQYSKLLEKFAKLHRKISKIQGGYFRYNLCDRKDLLFCLGKFNSYLGNLTMAMMTKYYFML